MGKQNQAFYMGVIASRHMVDADTRAQAVRCACTHGQLMGGTLSGLLRQEAARSKQMVARIGRMDWGAGAWRTLRMKYRSSESVITPLTDRWQGPDRIAPPKRGRHLSQKSPLRKSRIQEFNVK